MNILKLNKAKSNLENRINHMWNNIEELIINKNNE